MNAASGVDPQWETAGAPTGYTWMPGAQREYQVCLKCHSGFTDLPTYSPDGWDGNAFFPNGLYKLENSDGRQNPDHRDLAVEFNPNNSSFHPVVALGRNQSIPPASFVNGWSSASLMYCSDCHTNANAASQGNGPHGSPRLHVLDGQAEYTTIDNGVQPGPSEICFKCHDYETYVNDGPAANTLFRDGGQNLHVVHTQAERTSCYVCHDTHGSEQLHLINFDTSVVVISGANRDSQNAWESDGMTGACFVSCHNQGHGFGKSYTP
jgi:hypothetical protein